MPQLRMNDDLLVVLRNVWHSFVESPADAGGNDVTSPRPVEVHWVVVELLRLEESIEEMPLMANLDRESVVIVVVQLAPSGTLLRREMWVAKLLNDWANANPGSQYAWEV